MKQLDALLKSIDRWQQSHRPLAFGYAVVKKYGDDQAGYQAALVTYYGFLSLFPLLLVLTTVAGLVGRHNPAFGKQLVEDVTNYFPVLGDSLDKSVKGVTKTGPALIVGIIFTLYGARGSADAFRNAVNHVWHIPLDKRSGFPRSLLRSFSLIFGGGLGFIAASAVTTWAATYGGVLFRVLSIIANVLILYVTFLVIFRLSLPLSISRRQFRLSAIICACGVAVLQIAGTALLVSQSRHLASSYAALFATTLVLLAWIYLQAQVVLYATEISTVYDKRLWPRSLSGKLQTKADKLAAKRRSF